MRPQLAAETSADRTREREAADGVLLELRRILREAQDAANAVAAAGTASAWRGEANAQCRAADVWRYVAVGLGVLTAAMVLVLLVWRPAETGSLSVEHVTSRLGFAVILGGVAAYAARQSGQHRQREQVARRLELELTAFPPFVEGLKNKDELRCEYARRLFKGAESDDATEGAPRHGDHTAVSGKLAGVVLDQAAKVVGRGGS